MLTVDTVCGGSDFGHLNYVQPRVSIERGCTFMTGFSPHEKVDEGEGDLFPVFFGAFVSFFFVRE